MQLYNLVASYNEIWNMVSDPDADFDLLEETLQSIEAAIDVKAKNIAAVIENLNEDINSIKNQIDRLQKRKQTFENRVNRLKAYLQQQLEAAGIEKVSTPLFTVSIRNNPPAVDVYDANAIPAEYQVIKYDFNKAAIKEALKSGRDVPGARLVQSKSLQIR